MGSVYPRRRKLWLKYVDEDGITRYRKTPFERDRDEELARQLLEKVEAKVKLHLRAKERTGVGDSAPLTLRAYGNAWVKKRIAKSEVTDRHTSANDEKRALERYVYGTTVDDGTMLGDMHVKEIRPTHIRQLVEKLEKRPSRKGGTLSPRTICNAHGTLHTLFEHARADELVVSNPCDLPAGVLPARDDKDPSWRNTAVFSRQEVELLISAPAIPPDRQVIGAILFLAGVRWGEMAALQWRDWDTDMQPLTRLTVNKSFSQKVNRVKVTKTGKERWVPVHPTLAAILTDWFRYGWEHTFGRAPAPEDLIVPNAPTLFHSSGKVLAPELRELELERVRDLPPTARARYRLSQLGLTRFHEDCEKLGVRVRRNHDARRTLNSLLLADGGRDPIRSYIVWGPGKKVSDIYTTLPWETFCAEMIKLRIERRASSAHAQDSNHAQDSAVDRSAQAVDPSSARVTHSVTRGGTSRNRSEIQVGRTGFGAVETVFLDKDDLTSALRIASSPADLEIIPANDALPKKAVSTRACHPASDTRAEALRRALRRYHLTGDHVNLAQAVELFLGASEEELTT